MNNNKLSFTQEVKQEILSKIDKDFNVEFFLKIVKAFASIVIENGKTKICIKSSLHKLIKLLYASTKKYFPEVIIEDLLIETTGVKQHKNYLLYLLNIESLEQKLNNITIKNKKNNEVREIYEWSIAFFLAWGSINSPSSRFYHLEIQISNLNDSEKYVEIMKKNFNFKKFNRQNKDIIYIKRAEDISDFLKFLGCFECMFKYEEKRIERDLYTSVNRLNNIDISNQNKTIQASVKYSSMWKQIIAKNKQNHFSQKDEKIILLKIENNQLSNQEIANLYNERYGENISKEVVNYSLRKINEIYNKSQ
ncbi:MAG: DNA-binding protein WhiA [Mycoplasma sp.]